MKSMYVRNTQPGPTVFDEGGYEVIWQGKGDPTGEDVQVVPEEMAESFAFQRSLHRGIFEVLESSPETQELLDKAKEVWQRRQAQRQGTTLADVQEPAHEAVPMENPTQAAKENGQALNAHVMAETGVDTSNQDKQSAIQTAMPVKMMPRGSIM